MPDHANPVRVIGRPALAAWLLLVLTIAATGCQASGQASRIPASPSPVTPARPTPSPTDTPGASHGFGSLAVDISNDTDIWLLVGDDTPRSLTQGRCPKLSPDGCSVVIIRDSANPPRFAEDWIVAVDDPIPGLLFWPQDVQGGLVYGLEWSPDSRSIAVTTGGDIKRIYSGNLWLVDSSDGTLTQLAERDAGVPHFSPDGEWIATSTPEIGWSHGSIGLWHVESRSGQTLFGPLMLQYLEWADDSSGFAAALQRHSRHHETGLELWWVPVDGDPMYLGRLSNASYASWQPDTGRIAYYSPEVIEDPEDHTAHSFHSLHLANRDGSGDEVVPGSVGMEFWNKWALDLPGASPWSPDGRWLLTADRDGHTYIVDTDNLRTPLLLSVDRVHGWLDATHYLASTYQLGTTELYSCVPPETCQALARLGGEIQGLSYTEKVCRP